MFPLEEIRARILTALPGAEVGIVTNPGPAAEHSLLLDGPHAVAVAGFLRDDPELCFDYCSNVTGVDWLDSVVQETVIVRETIDGNEADIEKKFDRIIPGYLEAVYHLYSMERKHGPVVLRLRTGNRDDAVDLPSLTPVWRSAEFQEREIFDLYGIRFRGHPDLRRLLMWDEFVGYPMRKDYVSPPDDEDREPFTPARRKELS